MRFFAHILVSLILVASSALAQDNPANTGTGNLSDDYEIPDEILDQLDEASAAYASYESKTLERDENDQFIPHSVFIPDTRQSVLETTVFPYSAVVQILALTPSGEASLCSGAMIAPDIVLTAAHCIHSGTSAGHRMQSFMVMPGRTFGSAPFGRCKAIETVVLEEWVTHETDALIKHYDMGALKLDCAVGNDTGWFGLEILAEEDLHADKATTILAYAGDKKPAGVQWQSDDHLRALQDLNGFYQNDTFGGSSGAPVFTLGQNNIFCIHTNGRHNGGIWNDNNACNRITPERIALIEKWKTGHFVGK